ncbi:MAG: hypothetical protein WBR15_06190 [Gammaproteobacteria bacterium]
MNSTRKIIFAIAFAVNAAAIAAITTDSVHQHSMRQANTIELGTIVVTPADAIPGTVNLGAIVVTPSDADWRYAGAHGVRRQAATLLAESDTGNRMEDSAAASLVQTLNALSPGQFLDADAAMRLLNMLAFEGQGG